MKKLLSILIALIMLPLGALAETPSPAPTADMEDAAGAVYSVYDFEGGETMEIDTAYWVSFDDLFKLEIPAGWQNYALTEAQAANGLITCFGDGTHFMFVGCAPDTGDYADMTEYGMTLELNESYASVALSTINETEFVFFVDYESTSSNCATIIPGKGIYTFYFYPSDGDREFAEAVLDLVMSYTPFAQEK